jgi:cytidine deaminase
MHPLYEPLITAAFDAVKHAYCPYSRYKVGAAVLGGSGKIYAGCNVENVSYGLSCCAERVAVFKAISEGERKIQAIAVVLGSGDMPSPCGACRQVLYEFGKDADIIMCAKDGSAIIRKVSDLLLLPFDKDALMRKEQGDS